MPEVETAEERAAMEAASVDLASEAERDAFRVGWLAGRAYARREEARPYGGGMRLMGCSHEPSCRTVRECISRKS
jgi:hypothetical protein